MAGLASLSIALLLAHEELRVERSEYLSYLFLRKVHEVSIEVRDHYIHGC